MKLFLRTAAAALLYLPNTVEAFLSYSSSTSSQSFRLYAEEESSTNGLPELEGKDIYQRTFYRLTPGSQVSKPNAIVLEERLRFQADPENSGYILPVGPRTFIFRKGTAEDEITAPLYRFDLGGTSKPHNGPGTMESEIATILWMASNPHLIQGDVLELGCESGAVGVMGCMGAKIAMEGPSKQSPTQDEEILTVPKHENVFPERMHHLTLSDEGEDSLREAYETIQHFSNGQISLKDIRWGARLPPGMRYDRYYRTIIGSDLDISYPNSKEFARNVANRLLPSNELAIQSTRDGAATSSSFGGLGMDMEDPSPQSSSTEEKTVDSSIPPTFVHVAPDVRENSKFLRQFLENGFRMTVDSGYITVERLSFVFQTLEQGEAESKLEDMDDLELKDDSTRGYQFIRGIHHPDYAGEGSGEYFFPLETGEYEAGSKSTWLEPEEGGSPW